MSYHPSEEVTKELNVEGVHFYQELIVDNTGRPLCYHCDDSVVVFRYYPKKVPNTEEQMISHTAPQHFSSPDGTLFIEFYSPSTASAGLDIHVLLVRVSCLP